MKSTVLFALKRIWAELTNPLTHKALRKVLVKHIEEEINK